MGGPVRKKLEWSPEKRIYVQLTKRKNRLGFALAIGHPNSDFSGVFRASWLYLRLHTSQEGRNPLPMKQESGTRRVRDYTNFTYRLAKPRGEFPSPAVLVEVRERQDGKYDGKG
jgi:hypothetical protein